HEHVPGIRRAYDRRVPNLEGA
ncbi:MAG: hypothetical protein QOF96_1023, partial [Actinomycetota bacterium]|nr:hypothetical protein [Actinomycetota bacterium]